MLRRSERRLPAAVAAGLVSERVGTNIAPRLVRHPALHVVRPLAAEVAALIDAEAFPVLAADP
jgi:hypothetical protein